MDTLRFAGVYAAFAIWVHVAPAHAQAPAARPITFDGAEWVTTDPDAKTGTLLDRDALSIRTGEIWRRDLQFTDGTIEFDMLARPVRSFLGLMFRVSEENGRLTYEDIYFRPTSSGEWDAVQYEPVFQGIGGWQLYHGEGFSSPATIPTDRWIHVRLVVAGDTAVLYLDGDETPALRVSPLKGKNQTGHVGFWGFFPAGEPRTLFTANFANVTITPGRAPVAPAPARASNTVVASGLITTWRVAQPVAAAEGSSGRQERSTTTVVAEPSGIVNLSREFPHSVDSPKPKTWASAAIVSDRARRVGLRIGYSDRIRVLLNDESLFDGKNVFHLRYPPSLGLVRLGDQVVYLPLRPGTNELVLEIEETEDFGWGFIAEITSIDGLVVR